MDEFKQYWRQWLWRDAVTRLITVNFLVWAVCALSELFGLNLTSLLALPYTLSRLAVQPWSVVTYMFAHHNFLHMFVNMMWLLLFGGLFMQAQGGTRLVTLYIIGGVAGAVTFMLFHQHPYLLGASGAVFAIIGASMLLFPNWEVNLLIFGPVKVMWISVTAIVLFIVIGGGADQMLVHVVGLTVGVAYALLRKQGTDITKPFAQAARTIKAIRKPRISAHPAQYSGTRREENELDLLLEKVGRQGYDSLTAGERQRLFDLSQKIKR